MTFQAFEFFKFALTLHSSLLTAIWSGLFLQNNAFLIKCHGNLENFSGNQGEVREF